MKSERRHELEHNELADWTAATAEKIKPYTNVILIGTLSIVILAVGLSLWTKQREVKQETAWSLYHTALTQNNLNLLQDVAEVYDGSDASEWANASKGDIQLINGCEKLFTDKADANQELDQAIESYTTIESSQNPLIRARATFGLARAYEAKGELDKAKKIYKQATKQKNSPYVEIAQARLTDLENPNTLAFYDKFEAYEPKPALSPAGTSSAGAPSFESTDLPEPKEKAGDKKASDEKPAEEKKEEK